MNASGSSSQGRRGRKPPAESGAEPIVTTTGGQVRGLTAPGGYVFRGLPYAAPPVGDLRWRPPRQPADWQGVRDATVFGPRSPQPQNPTLTALCVGSRNGPLLDSPSGHRRAAPIPGACVARFFGDLVGQTRMVVQETEEILRNDARVVLDFSGVTSFDNLGLEAALGLVDTVRSSGGRVTIGGET